MIEYVTIDQAAELDAFVLRQPNCHFMQTSVWGRVKEGWGWTGILCRDEKGEIIGSMAILEHRIRHMHTGFLYAPRSLTAGRIDADTHLTHLVEQVVSRSWQAVLPEVSISCWHS